MRSSTSSSELRTAGPRAARHAKRLVLDRPDGAETARRIAERRTSDEGQEGLARVPRAASPGLGSGAARRGLISALWCARTSVSSVVGDADFFGGRANGRMRRSLERRRARRSPQRARRGSVPTGRADRARERSRRGRTGVYTARPRHDQRRRADRRRAERGGARRNALGRASTANTIVKITTADERSRLAASPRRPADERAPTIGRSRCLRGGIPSACSTCASPACTRMPGCGPSRSLASRRPQSSSRWRSRHGRAAVRAPASPHRADRGARVRRGGDAAAGAAAWPGVGGVGARVALPGDDMFLAALVLRERLRGLQLVGVALALVAVMLISSA